MSGSEEDSDYNASESDEDYNENEKILLKKVRNRNDADSDESEEEVLGVGEEDSDHSDIALSDVEGQEDDDLPDIRAWGKSRKDFYSTDYVDPDYGGIQAQNAQAEMEEDEVNIWEKDLQQQLADADFSGITTSKESEKKEEKDVKKTPRSDKLKDSKDFYIIVDLYNDIVNNNLKYLTPIITKYKKGQIPNCLAIDFVNMMYELSLNFCTNVSMYLLLKASQVDLKKHPIIKRLNQYRQMLDQISPTFHEVIKPQIDLLLEEDKVNNEMSKKTLKLLQKLTKRKAKDTAEEEVSKNKKKKKVKFDDKVEELEETVDNQEEEHKQEDEEEEADSSEIVKRPINYQIAKNKGLTPHRKKEQRNPRVKHRNKFRKANIRRKGAVRTPRTEVKKYGGEISGIKATVSKSIKIKS